MTELTLDSDLNRSQRESLVLVHSLARSLLLIIDDILDISKSTSSPQFMSKSATDEHFTSRGRSYDHGTGPIFVAPDRLRYLKDLSRPCIPEPAGPHLRSRPRHFRSVNRRPLALTSGHHELGRKRNQVHTIEDLVKGPRRTGLSSARYGR